MDIDPIDLRVQRQKELAELEAFIKSPIHERYKIARQQEICSTEETILQNDPITREDEIEQFKLRGEIRCLREMLTIFEDARVSLITKLDEMIEDEQENTTRKQ